MDSTQAVSALSVAEYFVSKANQEGKSLTNKKIQKLAYYAQAWSLAINNKKIFDEKIEAWVHGPVVRTIYDAYKRYGFSSFQKVVDESLVTGISEVDKKILDNVWKVYGKFDSSYLEMLTHSESPWQDARAGLDATENSEIEITPDSMREYYSKKLVAAV